MYIAELQIKKSIHQNSFLSPADPYKGLCVSVPVVFYVPWSINFLCEIEN